MQNLNSRILAIESSCDDTSCAVVHNTQVLSNVTAGQAVHAKYGGVVPELASRDHQRHIIPVVTEALRQAQTSLDALDAIAVTEGPGLMGSLLVGISVAKSLALALGKPLVGVNHMQGHVLAHFVEGLPHPGFPFLCLTVSGGHTQLVRVDDYLQMTVLGETIDDAAGEAFDKAAKILGLPYPGGPLIDRHAKGGDDSRFTFAAPRVPGLDYSFSGIKTSFLYFIRRETAADASFVARNLADICASYQRHLVNVILANARRALQETGIRHFAIAGGVSANSALRAGVQRLGDELGVRTYIPPFEYCTDNAAMIGVAASFSLRGGMSSPLSLVPRSRMPISR